MIRDLKKVALVLLGGAFCSFGFVSCAKDLDDFFAQHQQDLAERDVEDAAIRADLQAEIGNLRTEITGKIAVVEQGLHDLIEQGGVDVLGHLSEKSAQARQNVDTRYAQFQSLMSQKFGSFQTQTEQMFASFGAKLATLETELKQAIAQNNTQRAQEIQQFIDKVKAEQSKVQNAVQTINGIQTQYADIIAQADQLQDMEERMKQATQRYDVWLEVMPQKLQEAEAKLEALKEAQIAQLAADELQAYKDKLAGMNQNLEKMKEAMQKLQEMKDAAEELVQKFDNLNDEAQGCQPIVDNFTDAYDHYDEASTIISTLEAVDVSNYEGLLDDLSSRLSSAAADLHSAMADMSGLENVWSDYAESMENLADECETNADYCEGMMLNIQEAFEGIPFPS